MKAYFAIFALVAACFSQSAPAATQNLAAGQVYMGKEAVNEHLTGNTCFITIQATRPFPEKGLHCHTVDFLFSTTRDDVPKDTLRVDSRITNYHLPEFPKLRTCAMNVDGTTNGGAMYGEDTALIYNQIFGGQTKAGSTQYDYFLTLAPDTKQAVRARVHIQELFTERDVDCVRLEKM